MEKPILFSSAMINAILSNRKSQTRRIVKPQPNGMLKPQQLQDDGFFRKEHIGKWLWETKDGEFLNFCPYGQIGDILWVRETWRPTMFSMPIGWPYDYRATAKEDGCPEEGPWKPSIFMPKEASRIKLKVTDIRVERVQNITEEDAIAEGITMNNTPHKGWYWMEGVYSTDSPTFAYELLWSKINGKDSWKSNPWVWVIEFKKA